ncbi:MAG: hypothetical protein EPO68_04625 [Planctomycetota bacterium]|nr:MAG: hypothetical protein EPO68_04625 [Planctomycetota bacterium]
MPRPSRSKRPSRAPLVALLVCGASAFAATGCGTSAPRSEPAAIAATSADEVAPSGTGDLDLPSSPRAAVEPPTPEPAPLSAATEESSNAVDEVARPAQEPPAHADEVARLLQQGKLEEAHSRLGRQLLDTRLARATELLAAGAADEALVVLDEALALAPDEPRLHYLRGIGLLRTLEAALAHGQADSLMADFAVDALQAFERCPVNTASAHAAAHAAWLASRSSDALRHARSARSASADPDYPWLLASSPERVRYDAAALALRDARAQPGAATDELLEECRGELAALLANDPLDTWAWRAFAAQERAAGDAGEAVAVLERAIDRLPASRELWNDWRELARELSGARGAADRAAALAERHPQTAAAMFHAGAERFEAALVRMPEDPGAARDEFRQAEELVDAARATDPTWDEYVRRYEVVCRAGVGWASLALGRSEESEIAFRSMSAVLDDGLEWKLEGRLGSGIEGLDALGRDLAQRWDATHELEPLERAAAIYATLHEVAPREVGWSNKSGVFQRELALELAQRAQALCAAARAPTLDGELASQLRGYDAVLPQDLASDAGRAALVASAQRLAARARELMQRSWDAHVAAVDQEPDSLRALNDAALVQIRYLRTDLARAEALLRRSVELGERQLADATLAQRARYELQNAWGDAHQSLGVLSLVHRRDALTARLWFEKALAIGPDPRPLISNEYLPACADGADPDRLPESIAIQHWGEACPRP